ncbi:unnamed protein product [Paramecium pentaurelia]|uniref:Uncharacterized protein n=1 Tax=Paramecium pentaurelia TaxID=43138 RepID=A0A8S1VD45_9CILI|nr:unnamed protein product [Paramecium pentaurelia]
MKPNQKVLDHLKKYDYYLPLHLDYVQKWFYEQMVDNLGLSESFRTSFLSQISKIGQYAHNEQQFRQLVRDSWFCFLNKKPLNFICIMIDGQEQNAIKEFLLNVLIQPKQYDITYIDELLQIYEYYLQGNGGVVNIINRTKFRMILSKLNCSRFILNQDERIQLQIKQYMFDLYLKNIEKIDEKERINVEFITRTNIFNKLFQVLFDQIEGQGNMFNHLKQIVFVMIEEQLNILISFQILKSFYQMYLDKEKLLFERIDSRVNFDHNRIARELNQKYKEKKDLVEALKSIVQKQTQTINYKLLLRELVTKDIYSKENEQILNPILKEFDINNQQKNKRQQYIDNDLIQQIKLLGFNKLDKRNENEYDNLNFSINIIDNNNIIVINKRNNQKGKCQNIKELYLFMKNSNI